MSLETILHSGLNPPRHQRHETLALVLMGGGARTAYQVGVLQAVGRMLSLDPTDATDGFPFHLLAGTSAGALNAAFLAGNAPSGLRAFQELADFWMNLRSHHVYALGVSPWTRLNRWIAALQLRSQAMRFGAVLDTLPLVDTLHRVISLPGIEHALQSRTIDGLAVSAASYTTGVHWTFCQTRDEASFKPWDRPGRRGAFETITIEHLMASSAIPFIFPSTRLWVENRGEFFGDGSMRQISPLSPAMHMGASRILVVGAGQPQRAAMGAGAPPATAAEGDGHVKPPSLGAIAGFAMASVFHDTLQADVEQTVRVTETLQTLPPEIASVLPYRPVRVMSITPSQSLDALAQAHVHELPSTTRGALEGLGALRGGGAALASYLLFEPGFVQSLMQLGEQDAYAQKTALLDFLAT